MSYDTSSDTKVVNLNPVGYSSDTAAATAAMPSPVPSVTRLDGGRRNLSSSSSSGSSSSGSRYRSRKNKNNSKKSESDEEYSDDEEDYSEEDEDGKEKAANKVVVKKDDSVSSKSSGSEASSADTDEESEESEEEEDAISMTSTEILENDPLFFVLSRIFVTQDKKKNIADLIQEVVDLLKEQRDHRMQRENRMSQHVGGGHNGSVSLPKY